MTNKVKRSEAPYAEQIVEFTKTVYYIFGAFYKMENEGYAAKFYFKGILSGIEGVTAYNEKIVEIRNYAHCTTDFKIDGREFDLEITFHCLYEADETPAENAESPVETINREVITRWGNAPSVESFLKQDTTTETPAENAESPVETITDAEAGSAVIGRVVTVSGRFATASLDKAKIDNLKVQDNQVSELITKIFDLSDGKDQTWIVGGKSGYTPLFVSQDEDGKVTVSVFSIFK